MTLRALVLLLSVLALLCISPAARAETALVVLVRPTPPSSIVHEAITRIRGELMADGFNVLVVGAVPGEDARSMLSRVGQETGAAATLGLVVDADAQHAHVWVVDRVTNKTVLRSLEMPTISAHSAPDVLARRAVELLRASLLEILLSSQEAAVKNPQARAQAARWAARGLKPSRWGVEAGAQILGGFTGIDLALMPVARARFALGRGLSARLTLAGLGTRPRVVSKAGSATVSQALGLGELVGQVAWRRWLRPFVSLGAGAYHIGIEGSAAYPYLGLEDERFVFAADAGAGLALSLTSSLALSLEGHATLVTPYPVIRFLELSRVEVGNPLAGAALTLVAQL